MRLLKIKWLILLSSLSSTATLCSISSLCTRKDIEDNRKGCYETKISKGPYVWFVSENTAKIRWETEDSGCFTLKIGSENYSAYEEQFEVTFSGNRKEDIPGTRYMYNVTLSTLEPGKNYEYLVGGVKGNFSTAVTESNFKFVAIGDTLSMSEAFKKNIENILSEKPHFVVHLGDIQYYVHTDSWARIFAGLSPILTKTVFFTVPGNHEYEFSKDEYTQYYLRFFPYSPTGYYSFDYGMAHFTVINTEESISEDSPQLKWLVEDLKTDKKWKIVLLHRPVFTQIYEDFAQSILLPIFSSSKVNLVLSGHSHAYERFEYKDLYSEHKIHFIVSGGGGASLYYFTHKETMAKTVKAEVKYNIVVVEITNKITLRAIDHNKTVFDEFSIESEN